MRKAFFLAVLALVWIADIGAYFFGRLFGRHKLAVNISPGKTWEGAIGGGLAVLVYGLLMRHFFQHEATPLWLCLLGLLASLSLGTGKDTGRAASAGEGAPTAATGGLKPAG